MLRCAEVLPSVVVELYVIARDSIWALMLINDYRTSSGECITVPITGLMLT